MIFVCFALFLSMQIWTADRTRKMVPIMAPNGGGPEIDLSAAVRAGGVGRGRGGVIYVYMYIYIKIGLPSTRPEASRLGGLCH